MAKTFCDYPDYVVGNVKVLPYFIPFRALTVDNAPNLLVAGKSIASSFYANAALRLHPEEWSSGVAAGVSAALMSVNAWTSTGEAMMNVHRIREQLESMGAPLRWTL